MTYKSFSPSLLCIAAVAAIACLLHFIGLLNHPLELHQRYGSYGASKFALRDATYPRLIDDSEGYALKIYRPARSLASESWAIDEYVYTIAPPESVVAVSEFAFQRTYSNVFQWADVFHPAIATDPEVILKLNPDLLLVSSDARADFTHLLRTAGQPTFRVFTSFTKLSEISESIRLVGYLTGQDDEAKRVGAGFDKAVRQARKRKPASMPPPRVLGFAGSFTYGDQTLFNDIIQTLGGINVGAESGLHGYSTLNSEQILAWNPDWIISGANRGDTSKVIKRLLEDPAVALTSAAQHGRIIVLENNVFMPMSPYTALLLDSLASALYEAQP